MLPIPTMPFSLHCEALSYAAFSILFLYISGFWLAHWLETEQTQAAVWAWTPVLGLAVSVLALTNLSYIGLPARISAPVLAAAFGLLDALTIWRRKVRWRMDPLQWSGLALTGAGTGLLLLPYVLFGGFHYFGDPITYAAIGDFLRDNSYFHPAEPAHLFPWLSQMLLYQVGHFRIGATMYLSGTQALLGIDGYTAFMPVTAAYVFVSFCGIWLLGQQLLKSMRYAQAVAQGGYCFNVTMVYWPAIESFMSQVASLGLVYAIQAIALKPGDGSHLRRAAGTGILVGALLSVYPEILPFALAPLFLYHLYRLIRRTLPLHEVFRHWLLSLLVAAVVNPYTWTYAVANVIQEIRARPGFQFLPPSPIYLEYLYGLGDPTGSVLRLQPAAVFLGLVLTIITVLGVLKLDKEVRAFAVLSLGLYTVIALYQWQVADYAYGFLKALTFMAFMAVIGLGSGMGFLLSFPPRSLPGGCGRASGIAWAALLCLFLAIFEFTGYGMAGRPWYPHPVSAGRLMEEFFELRSVSGVPKTHEKTLVVVPNDNFDKWISYFFRRPVGDLFPSAYFEVINNRPIGAVRDYQYVLALSGVTQWRDEERVIFRNRIFAFSRMQPFLMQGKTGWHGREISGGQVVQWMNKRAEMIACAPTGGSVRLRATIHLTPDRRRKHLNLIVGGKIIESYYVDREPYQLQTGEVQLQPGLNTLIFETEEEPTRYGSDPRLLSLLWEPIQLVRNAPAFLSAANPNHVPFLEGLSGGWVSDSGLRVRFTRPDGSRAVLKIHGNLWNLKQVLPQRLQITADGKALQPVVIRKPGVFDVSVVIPVAKASSPLDIRILPEKTFCPKELGMNNDPRHLAFGAVALELVE